MGSQIILLRECLATLYGNEMVCATTLAAWLFWVAVGSLLGSSVSFGVKWLKNLIAILMISAAWLLPLTIFVVRFLKNILSVPVGEMMGFGLMAAAAFLTLAPLSFIFGGLFTLICKWARAQFVEAGAGEVYLWEAKGAAIGGIFVSLLLLPFFSNLQIAMIFSLANLLVGLFIFFPKHTGPSAASVLFLSILLFVPKGGIDALESLSQKAQWPHFTVLEQTDSIHGRITLLKLGEELSLYENGLLDFSTGDVLPNEERVHFAMLAHPDPRNVLLIGGGLGGGLEELLKYRDVRVDYIELDPKIVDISQDYFSDESLRPLLDTRVNLLFADGRRFVKMTPQKYDVIIIALPNPATAFVNRYYTREFFKEARAILSRDGILSLSVASSENYLSSAAKSFLRSIHSTLKSIFPSVQSIPGDTNIFLAASAPAGLNVESEELIRRLKTRGIKTQYVNEYYLPSKVSQDRRDYIQKVLAVPGQINSDDRPMAYFYDAVLWSTYFESGWKNVLTQISWIAPVHLAVFPGILLLVGFVGTRIRRELPIFLTVMTTGFSGIIFQVITILVFQTLFGYAYYQVGLIFGAFMVGLVLGCRIAIRFGQRPPQEILRLYQIVQAGISICPLILPVIFTIFHEVRMSPSFLGAFGWGFSFLPVVAGFGGGIQYPLAVRLLSRNGHEDPGRAGILYALDVLGASAAGLVAGAILVPLTGINAVVGLCVALNAVGFILLWMRRP